MLGSSALLGWDDKIRQRQREAIVAAVLLGKGPSKIGHKEIVMLNRLLFAVAALTPQAALAANVYMPIVCFISSAEELECALDHVDATQSAPDEWEVQVTAGDTVYFQVSDFTHGADYYSVDAQTHYSTASFTSWTKSGSTAISPGETPVIRIELEVEATTPGRKSKVRRAIGDIKVRLPGG